MNRTIASLSIAALLLVGCNQEEVKNENMKAFDSNPDFWVYAVEESRSLKSNLFIQLTNQSSEIDPVNFTIYIDDKFVLSTDVPNLRQGHHQEVYGMDVPEGSKTIRIESKNGNVDAEMTFDLKGRKFILATFWSPREESPSGHIEILEGDRVFYISERRHIQSELSTPFALLTT